LAWFVERLSIGIREPIFEVRFETVEDECYREAIDLMLAGIDPAHPGVADKDRNEASMFEACR
jgi:hypothetical protein